MIKKSGTSKDAADKLVRGIKRKTRRHYSAEEKIRIVLAGLRGEEGIVGATHVYSQPADGYTVGVFTANIISTHIIRGNATYDREEFEPIAGIIGYGQLLATAADAPYNNCHCTLISQNRA